MIKNIIFDLDGTLWQTNQSYIYAYQKLCAKYHKNPQNGFNEVLTYMGIKVDILLKDLFPEIIDQTEIIKEALNYSIEYIINNPSNTCYEYCYEILRDLSKNYNIYIISNCLKEYVETFLKISNTTDFVKGFYTIELGEKSSHLNKITNGYIEKAIFIGDDIEDYNQIENHKKVYFVYAKYGYKKCNTYDYYIDKLADLKNVINSITRKERILKNNDYEIISSNDTNITLIQKTLNIFYFGFVNVSNLTDLQIVIEKMKEKVNHTLIGPIDGNTFYPYRFVIDNFDWILYPDLNNTKDTLDLFYQQGFKINQLYSSTLGTVNEKVYAYARKCKLPSDLEVKVVEGESCYQYIEDLYDVAVEAFSQADYYEEISKEDFFDMYLDALKLCSPDLVLIYQQEKLVAFHFGYEDLEKRFYVSKTIGIKKNFRNKIVLMKLIDYAYTLMIKKGYKEVLYHFQNERTKTLAAIHKGCEIKKKNYALLEYKNEKRL